jgi:hypothetical protein
VPWGGVVVYEAAIPWSLLAPANPLTDDSIALNIVTIHRGGRSARRFGMLEEDRDFDTERTPVRRGRALPLVRRQTAAVGTIVARLPRPVIELGDTVDLTVGYQSAAVTDPVGGDAVASIDVEIVQAGSVVAAVDMPVVSAPALQRRIVRLVPGIRRRRVRCRSARACGGLQPAAAGGPWRA